MTWTLFNTLLMFMEQSQNPINLGQIFSMISFFDYLENLNLFAKGISSKRIFHVEGPESIIVD
jgi:hypothetical protein